MLSNQGIRFSCADFDRSTSTVHGRTHGTECRAAFFPVCQDPSRRGTKWEIARHHHRLRHRTRHRLLHRHRIRLHASPHVMQQTAHCVTMRVITGCQFLFLPVVLSGCVMKSIHVHLLKIQQLPGGACVVWIIWWIARNNELISTYPCLRWKNWCKTKSCVSSSIMTCLTRITITMCRF